MVRRLLLIGLTFPRRALDWGRARLYSIPLLGNFADKFDGLLCSRNGHDLHGKLGRPARTKVRQGTDSYLDLVAHFVDAVYGVDRVPASYVVTSPEHRNYDSMVKIHRCGWVQLVILVKEADMLVPELSPRSTVPKDPGLGFPYM